MEEEVVAGSVIRRAAAATTPAMTATAASPAQGWEISSCWWWWRSSSTLSTRPALTATAWATLSTAPLTRTTEARTPEPEAGRILTEAHITPPVGFSRADITAATLVGEPDRE